MQIFGNNSQHADNGHSNETLFKAVTHQNKFEQLHDKFGEKDFVAEHKFWRYAALVLSWLINAMSISGAFYGAFSLFAFFGVGETLSAIIAVLILTIIEVTRRKAADKFWDTWWKLKKVAAAWMLLNLALLAISGVSSGYGVFHAVKDNAPKAPTLSDSVLVKMESELAALRADNETAKRTKWKGTVTVDAQRTIKNNSKSIADLTASINERRARLTGKQDETDISHGATIEQAGYILAATLVILEIVFHICFCFMSYFDWREYVLRLEQGQTSIAEKTKPENILVDRQTLKKLVANTATGGMYPLNIVSPNFAPVLEWQMESMKSGAKPFDKSVLDLWGNPQNASCVRVPTDIYIEHKDKVSGTTKRLNISQVRANISANKTHLKNATDAKKAEHYANIVAYWIERESELIAMFAAIENQKNQAQ